LIVRVDLEHDPGVQQSDPGRRPRREVEALVPAGLVEREPKLSTRSRGQREETPSMTPSIASRPKETTRYLPGFLVGAIGFEPTTPTVSK
jgi:hypothetical protein